jgi:hypothetical protein
MELVVIRLCLSMLSDLQLFLNHRHSFSALLESLDSFAVSVKISCESSDFQRDELWLVSMLGNCFLGEGR